MFTAVKFNKFWCLFQLLRMKLRGSIFLEKMNPISVKKRLPGTTSVSDWKLATLLWSIFQYWCFEMDLNCEQKIFPLFPCAVIFRTTFTADVTTLNISWWGLLYIYATALQHFLMFLTLICRNFNVLLASDNDICPATSNLPLFFQLGCKSFINANSDRLVFVFLEYYRPCGVLYRACW